MSEKRIIISGGGTGGHIFPAISIANSLKKIDPECEILFVGALGRMEMEKVPAANYKIVGLPVAGLKRELSVENLKLPFKIFKSLCQARKIVYDFDPDVAVGVGGYASGPVLWMASRMNIPILIQEQNSYAGLTNRILGKKAKKICVAYEGMEKFFKAEKIILTGNPVREGIVLINPQQIEEAYRYFELDPQKKTILIIGGSLGANTLNNCAKEWIRKGTRENIQLIWQYGSFYKNEIRDFISANPKPNVKAFEFIKRMDYAYAIADVVISRAGAGTISELAVAGKASVLIPSPNVVKDHQTHNAMALVRKNAAIMIPDDEAVEKAFKAAVDLAEDENKRKELETRISGMAIRNSAEIIAREVLKLAEK
ncbi:MAG TPA: undecaprenyldiphospho-muramoylpentapeptide beta-N-acetylglucosaminyltransferase [Rikenellaceae bacterium]|nr:undecaprenyldiphospho-muramoylpentapeptide beta-N-acetylglucosaminyltransferase [Rikenellaceae bacterium]